MGSIKRRILKNPLSGKTDNGFLLIAIYRVNTMTFICIEEINAASPCIRALRRVLVG